MAGSYRVLTAEQVEHFLATGFVYLPGAVPAGFVAEATEEIWTRLGYLSGDPSTWAEKRVHMAVQRRWPLREVSPFVWSAMCDLVGGEERILDSPLTWNDAFIVNLGIGSDLPWEEPAISSPGWHLDGDFFRHFLDSPEQGLLTIALYTDVVHQGGPTVLAPDSIGATARYLSRHPEGLIPDEIDYPPVLEECTGVVEATGNAGDVYLLHPFMLHCQSQNVLERLRVIANPPMQLREPMRFDREHHDDHSPVELAVLRSLGVNRLEFTATGRRERLVPARVADQERRKAEEDLRLDRARREANRELHESGGTEARRPPR